VREAAGWCRPLPGPAVRVLDVRRLLIGLLLLPALLLTACQQAPADDPAPTTDDVVTTDIADVAVEGETGEKPELSWDGRFEAAETERVVLAEGAPEQPVVQLGQRVELNYLGVNGRDGTEFDTSFGNPEPASFVLEEGGLIQGFIAALEGVRVGSRVVVGITPEDGYGPSGGQPDAGIEADDSLIFVIDVLDTTDVLARATGTPVPPMAGLPTVTLAADGTPTVAIPAGPPPKDLLYTQLITGALPPVQSGQTLTAHYVLVAWETGEVIESSWAQGAPVPLPIGQGQVMEALDAGLVDQPVGSQIMLVVPPDVASEGATTPVENTLVFVIDILDAR
jgi:peptidylprolyl isomerase